MFVLLADRFDERDDILHLSHFEPAVVFEKERPVVNVGPISLHVRLSPTESLHSAVESGAARFRSDLTAVVSGTVICGRPPDGIAEQRAERLVLERFRRVAERAVADSAIAVRLHPERRVVVQLGVVEVREHRHLLVVPLQFVRLVEDAELGDALGH